MSKFEFVTVVVSIVIAFALSEILSGIGRLVRERSRVDFYWVHVAWMAFAILWMLQHWWGLWDYRGAEFGGFFEFAAVVSPSLTFVLLAFLLTPRLASSGELDLRGYFLDNRGWIFGLVALVTIEISLVRILLTDESVLHPRHTTRAIALAGAVLLALTRDGRVHAVAVVLAFAGTILYSLTRAQY